MSDSEFSLGSRLRSLRKERALTQRELADLAGLSPNAISLIERDEISPSVATLQRLAQALKIKMGYFFESTAERRVIHARAGERPAITSKGLVIEGLGARLDDQQIEPFCITLAPQADTGQEPVVHAGHELVCCLTGRIEYTVDGVVYLLHPGDLLLFAADSPHHWRNPGVEAAQLLLVLQAPGGLQDPTPRHFTGHPSVTYIG